MKNMNELQREIETIRLELGEAFLQQEKFDNYYQKSTKLDKLIEEYLENKEKTEK